MAYYPTNFYSNYPYLQPQPQQQMQAPQSLGLQGKIVENLDMVRVTDVPLGSYGIFPKADLSEIYVKMWNGNGATTIATFKPVIQQENLSRTEKESDANILEKIQCLEEKLDTLIKQQVSALPQTRKEF